MGENHLPDSNQIVIWDILHYLMRNPDAKDTIDGILKWWIPKVVVIEQEKSKVQEALEMLAEKGFITGWETGSSQKYYGVTEGQLKVSFSISTTCLSMALSNMTVHLSLFV
ncbi:MAG: hypothetical protein DWB56_04920 [Candidatus Jettenia sp.]|uniref:Uncharacterized protein n=1 Tax=Candidatus Jettenia caeni TaxID=247490 RepID=I3IIB8_9BACT|nr:hypothetical protein [Candidatus Jettenia sp. AMX1]MBC6928297.1 hypothetical protein [Candidatus Jettenia sp.]NUN21960.1 hypothetical protein [Candidatus Jettenia caeni]KAA0249942.1 MAG: hypothetical protein EDM77_06655 [Candidatus Jettenia sp. AMX1]MCE7880420.1 hypothetical protein [Candidatus Jettenia sp. AMX1]MCQ3926228.1 hypothetical protein [Candidatus Jettenia sp.]